MKFAGLNSLDSALALAASSCSSPGAASLLVLGRLMRCREEQAKLLNELADREDSIRNLT